MRTKILATFTAAVVVFSSAPAFADPATAADELKELITSVQAKLKEGKKTETDLAPDLKAMDALLAKHKGEKTDDVAQILYMKATLYSQVLDNEEKGEELLKQLERDFPDSKQAADIKKQAAAKAIQAGLKVGSKFPDFAEKDTAGKPFSIASQKGRVVLIDFWATWCGPCVAELPNVLKAYEKHHAKGFEILGISLDKDRKRLEDFTKQKHMTWPQYFDGLYWQNKLAVKYGINSIPATYLLDGDGNIIAKNLRGEELQDAVAKALAKK